MSRIQSAAGPVRRCLGPELSAYADRAMHPSDLLAWDRHLVACTCCRQAVDAERRLLATLRGSSGPALPGDLRAVLLSLAAPAASAAETGSGAAVQATPLRIPPPPVPVVDRSAPALHRSAVRATVFAGLAAGASAAAAWSFAVVGTPLVPSSPGVSTPGTAVQRSRPAAPSFTSASFGTSFGASFQARTVVPGVATTVTFGDVGRPVVSGARQGSAESTP